MRTPIAGAGVEKQGPVCRLIPHHLHNPPGWNPGSIGGASRQSNALQGSRKGVIFCNACVTEKEQMLTLALNAAQKPNALNYGSFETTSVQHELIKTNITNTQLFLETDVTMPHSPRTSGDISIHQIVQVSQESGKWIILWSITLTMGHALLGPGLSW